MLPFGPWLSLPLAYFVSAAYAHSYGDRTGDILVVEPIPEPEPEPSALDDGELTGEFLRRAFERKLDKRKKLST